MIGSPPAADAKRPPPNVSILFMSFVSTCVCVCVCVCVCFVFVVCVREREREV